MSTELKSKAEEPEIRINRFQPYAIRHRAHEYGVSEAKLIEALNAVGPLVKDVKRYLGK